MLADVGHLASMTLEERQAVVRTFVEATIKAIPGARKYTMNGNTLPVFVLGVVREKGHPIQLVNAFETPASHQSGLCRQIRGTPQGRVQELKDTWGVEAVFDKAIPEVTLKAFLDEVVKHVV